MPAYNYLNDFKFRLKQAETKLQEQGKGRSGEFPVVTEAKKEIRDFLKRCPRQSKIG
jgi:hypothetical protein